jgi:hypothetical protein
LLFWGGGCLCLVHKRVYRIYRRLELNLRIKPRKRIVREKPVTLAVPAAINDVWSMDFMQDQLAGGRSIRLFVSALLGTRHPPQRRG